MPSGKLAIEGYGNLRISPGFEPDEEPGALFDVPPGEYIASIYSVQEDMQEDVKTVPRPNYVIVLTSLGQAEPLSERKPLLHMITDI